MERVIGIDVARDRLDGLAPDGGKRLSVGNEKSAMAALAVWAGPGALVVMEASGGCERLAHRCLTERGVAVAIVNPKRVRDFAKASGRLARTDRIDAETIARYGAFVRPASTPLPGPQRRAPGELLALRQRLGDEIIARRQQLAGLETQLVRERALAAIGRLQQEKDEIEALLRQTIVLDAELARAFALLVTMPGAGFVLAATLLARMPELGRLDRRQIASLAGLAPIAKGSGRRQGRHVIAEGRGDIRRALYMAAVSTLRGSSRFATFYRRLTAAGKPPPANRRKSPSSPPCARCSPPSTPWPAHMSHGASSPFRRLYDRRHITVAELLLARRAARARRRRKTRERREESRGQRLAALPPRACPMPRHERTRAG